MKQLLFGQLSLCISARCGDPSLGEGGDVEAVVVSDTHIVVENFPLTDLDLRM